MGRRLEARHAAAIQADQFGGDLATASLVISNPLRRQPLAVPSDVRLGDTPDGDPAILWNIPPARAGAVHELAWELGGSPEQAFWRFLDLAEEQEPGQFVAFVKRFGPLGLWPYETPDGHKVFGLDYWVPSLPDGISTPPRYTTVFGDPRRLLEEGLLGILYEPIAEWRRWAGWFRAIVDIAFELRAGRCGPRKRWDVLGLGIWFEGEGWTPPAPRFATDICLQRRVLAKFIQKRFVRWAGLVPVFSWDDEAPHLALALGGENAVVMPRTSSQCDWPDNVLFPALVAQLIAILSASEPIAACSRCGRLHPRKRKPRADQPVYCESCRTEARRKTKRESIARARGHSRATS